MTYSIVARDARTGEIGVAVQSHYFSVGSIVSWARAGVGAVATQSMAEVSYGPLGLAMLEAGAAPVDALRGLTVADAAAATRQVAMVDAEGRVAVHTGERCIAEAGHVQGDGFSVQANMMRGATVPDAMANAYLASDGATDLAERLLVALDAAQAAGGDVRGQQSAALLVVSGTPAPAPWQGVRFDLRVEDHAEPLTELRRLVALRRAYAGIDAGDERAAEGDLSGALDAYRSSTDVLGANPELAFWQGVMLAANGDPDAARPLLARAFATHDGWALLLRRLPAAGLFPDDPGLIDSLLSS